MTAPIAPRVRLEIDTRCGGVVSATAHALTMLAGASRIVLVGPDQPADICHTFGDAPVASLSAAPIRLHTVGDIPLRINRMVPTREWIREQRRRLSGVSLMTHGLTAARLVSQFQLVPGASLHCLPLVSPDTSAAFAARTTSRSKVRSALGIHPGTRLILMCGAAHGAAWQLLRGGRQDVVVVEYLSSDGGAPAARLWTQDLRTVPLRESFAELLAASDLVVAADRVLRAYSLAAAACEWGLPVIATTADSAADVVIAAGGVVVAPDERSLAAAMQSQVDTVTGRRRDVAPPATDLRTATLARSLLAGYRRAVRSLLVGGAA